MEEKEVNWEQDYKDLLGVCINSKNRIEELEEEIKSLKEDNDKLQTGPYKYSYIKKIQKQNEKLEEGIKKQKEICDVYVPRALRLEEKNKRLEKENLVMRERLKFGYKGVTREEIDRVEKVNKKLKEYNGELIENHKKDIAILCEENKKLKSDLSECECSFCFENDEVGFWKREYKRLKKWIKDHCKGYGNLFPEDEMKRQWKNADKKRK